MVKNNCKRYNDINKRSKHVQSICSNFKCHSEIVKYFDLEADAYEFEKELKKEYKKLGYPIIDGETCTINRFNLREGIEIAKREGKYKGRKPLEINEDKFKSVCVKWRAGELTATAAMQEVGLKPNTFYRRVKELGI